jgi:hypothetical protein
MSSEEWEALRVIRNLPRDPTSVVCGWTGPEFIHSTVHEYNLCTSNSKKKSIYSKQDGMQFAIVIVVSLSHNQVSQVCIRSIQMSG